MRWIEIPLMLLGGLTVLVSRAEPAVHPICPDDFEQLRKLVKPDVDEQVWMQIPWLTSLWEARRQAAANGKPILLWEMDGHPLGCT
jgi:hypothetical protein